MSGAQFAQRLTWPQPSQDLRSSIQTTVLAGQSHPPPHAGQVPKTGGGVTSWIKYLGCHGVRRLSRFRSSTRCFSSRRRFCSVAASMSPRRRYRVTSRQRFLGVHGGEEVVSQGCQAQGRPSSARRGQGKEGPEQGRGQLGRPGEAAHSRCHRDA